MSSITAVGLASLALAPAAVAQTPDAPVGTDSEYSAAAEPTATPTPTPAPDDAGDDVGQVGEPPPDASKRVRRVYRDFRRDAIIEPCDHTLYILRETRDTVPEDFDAQYPDFLESVKAAISERKELDCEAVAEEEDAEDAERDEDADSDEDAAADESASTGGGGAATPSTTPAPIDPLPFDPIDPLPSTPSDAEDEVAPDPLPPVETVAPLPEPVTPPPAAPAAPPVAPPVATPVPSTVVAEPATAPAPVWGLAAGGGLLALGGLLAPLFGASGGARLAAFEHAWGEAGFRVRGAWQDFRDWLRVGR